MKERVTENFDVHWNSRQKIQEKALKNIQKYFMIPSFLESIH